ncbi:glycosyltransferase [Streptomyces sanglieri]
MSRPKLVYLINAVDYGGAEIGMVRLLSGLDSDEFDVAVVALKNANPDVATELPPHVAVHALNLDTKITRKKISTLYKKISEADVIVGSLFPSVFVGTVFGTLTRTPAIYTWKHNITNDRKIRKIFNSLSFRLSDEMFVDSESAKEVVVEWGVEEQRITTLPLAGIKTDEYPTVGHTTASDTIRVGTVGRLTETKGYLELLECAKALPDYEFHVVGDGPLADRLRDSPSNVVWHGETSPRELKQRLWGSFDVYFQPSRYEGLCITAIEAMASGLPVVASEVGGLTESVVHGETGFLVPQGDIEGYCSRIEELANDPELRARLGGAGKRRVAERYSAEALAEQFRAAVKER